jgi:hypothetical protein
MFKGSRLELFLVVDHDHRILVVVVVLETKHTAGSLSVCSILPKPACFGVFLQPQREAKRRPDRAVRLTRLVITASAILSELRQIVGNLEPRGLAAHKNMAICAHAWIGVEGAQWKRVNFRLCIELCMNA